MYLFIFESLGTAELALIGIVALMFLGPRKLPEYARKIGKMMADFRNTTGEFKETWQREVNFDEEAKALRLDDLEDQPVARMIPGKEDSDKETTAPAVREIDPESFKEQQKAADTTSEESQAEPNVTGSAAVEADDETNDKRNWL